MNLPAGCCRLAQGCLKDGLSEPSTTGLNVWHETHRNGFLTLKGPTQGSFFDLVLCTPGEAAR